MSNYFVPGIDVQLITKRATWGKFVKEESSGAAIDWLINEFEEGRIVVMSKCLDDHMLITIGLADQYITDTLSLDNALSLAGTMISITQEYNTTFFGGRAPESVIDLLMDAVIESLGQAFDKAVEKKQAALKEEKKRARAKRQTRKKTAAKKPASNTTVAAASSTNETPLAEEPDEDIPFDEAPAQVTNYNGATAKINF